VSASNPQNIPPQHSSVDRDARSALLGHRSTVVWFTGISGSGKSTIANLVALELHNRGLLTFMLDGDNLRRGLSTDLGFSDADRRENNRRAGEVARLLLNSGVIVLAAFISPFRDERDRIKASFEPEEFIEVHVDRALAAAEQSDSKGLYARARRGEIADFTGIDSPYEPPLAPDLRIDTATVSPPDAAAAVIELLAARARLIG
jgi:bifunctional enzyme CysN/CysC